MQHDTLIESLVNKELLRQQTTVNLIASENYAPRDVLNTTASVLANKYAEGYPNKRYYAGCTVVDEVETIAIKRCKKLFGAEHANVQPHAGSQANMAAYAALLQPGDTIMGMSLAAGGHLTHGHTVNFSGICYNAIGYGVHKETELLDFEEIEMLAHAHTPKLIIAGASAYSRTIDFEHFAKIAHDVGAYFIADIAHIAGLVAAHAHPSPSGYADVITSTTHKTLRGPRGAFILSTQALAEKIDRALMPGTQGGPFMNVIAAKATCFLHAMTDEFKQYQHNVVANARVMATTFQQKGYRLVAGGTDNHLFILDLRAQKITGRAAEKLLEEAGITVSRSCIPFDPEKPWITSGIRIGTPAITSRGAHQQHVIEIAEIIDYVISQRTASACAHARQKIAALLTELPVYQTDCP